MAKNDNTIAPELDALYQRPRNNPRPLPSNAVDNAEDHGTGTSWSEKPDLYEDAGTPKELPRDFNRVELEEANKAPGRKGDAKAAEAQEKIDLKSGTGDVHADHNREKQAPKKN
jgi:hypothetical protein